RIPLGCPDSAMTARRNVGAAVGSGTAGTLPPTGGSGRHPDDASAAAVGTALVGLRPQPHAGGASEVKPTSGPVPRPVPRSFRFGGRMDSFAAIGMPWSHAGGGERPGFVIRRPGERSSRRSRQLPVVRVLATNPRSPSRAYSGVLADGR